MIVVGYGILASLGNLKFSDYVESLSYTPEIKIFSNNDVVLITLKSLYLLVDQYSPISILPPTFDQIKFLQDITGLNEEVKLYVLQIDKISLKICTFNLAYAVQQNIVSGSEANQVKKCQILYPKRNGWVISPYTNILSQCTLNAITFLEKQNCDLIGLQEVVSEYLDEYLYLLNEFSTKKYASISAGNLALIYDSDKLGQGQLLSSPYLYILQFGRGMMIVYFSLHKLLVVNLHAPHRVELQSAIESTFNSVPINVPVNRIIVMGDFNDPQENLSELNLREFKLKQYDKPPISCCDDVNYIYPGDYIFDSNFEQKGFYGIPTSAHSQLMSDHYPVIFEP